MAAEFERLATDFLKTLPNDHPDRPFLQGLTQTVSAYAGRLPVEELADLPSTSPANASLDEGIAVPEMQSVEAADAGQTEQERVRLSGRLGARPRFSTTPRGVPRAEFNLAVHEDDDSTTWHTVLAFRGRAEKLEAANPQKGQSAEVIGYKHTEERTDREGKPKTVERIVAAHIRLR